MKHNSLQNQIINLGELHFKSNLASKVLDKDLLKLQPYGLQVSADGLRPLLLLRDEKNEHTMPVGLNPLEAGVALAQSNKTIAPTSPHKVMELLLESLKLKIESCVFVEVRGVQLIVELKVVGRSKLSLLKVRADEAMSLCLHLNVPIYATAEYMSQARVINVKTEGQMKDLLANPELFSKNHKYIM